MARASKVEACMLCGMMPCECNKSASKPKRAVARRSKPVEDLELSDEGKSPVPVKKNALSAMKAVAKNAEPVVTPPPPRTDEEDAQFAAAVRALSPILHPTERARYSAILTAQPTLDERRAAWRSRVRQRV